MSASLVGSEMCIRDSGTPACKRDSRASPEGVAQGCAPSRRPLDTDPVSYTHLTLPTICSV
eukprot:2155760-Alexandrium_andersonii.AAC.1